MHPICNSMILTELYLQVVVHNGKNFFLKVNEMNAAAGTLTSDLCIFRQVLDSKYGLKRWQIGEVASKIGQLYYHY